MNLWRHEIRLLLRAPMARPAIVLSLLLTAAALLAGYAEIARQRAAIERIPALQNEDIAAVADHVAPTGNAGSAAYYSFHPTWDAPSALAFAAIGMRDVAPHVLRVRALGLEAQIYDGETYNPELALPGRFDFAFVLVYIAPLLLIALLHDLVSGEREAGRARVLQALPSGARPVWRRRAALRIGALWASLVLPFAVAALALAVPPSQIAVVAGAAGLYLLFWAGVATLVARRGWSSAANAAALAGCWLVLTLILPALAHVVINRAIPLQQGAEIALAQREAVNGAWDIPREDTMRAFYANHPEWADSPPLTEAFHYKWYLAFHQVGDERVAPQVRAYRSGLEQRAAAARALGWALPPVGLQALLTRLADTDLQAQMAYMDRIRAFHGTLRRFYYGYLFRDRPFTREDFDRAPRFEQVEASAEGAR
jgi:ABC-2 type transport system permease protein